MIDVRELRIGNVVNDDTNLAQEIGCKVVGIVESISEENIGLKYLRSDGDTFYGEEHPINLSPIPLTEELLLKSGFSYDPESACWKICGLFIRKVESGFSIFIECEDDWYSNCYFKDFEYLHQLQNIYFALTGKELEVSL